MIRRCLPWLSRLALFPFPRGGAAEKSISARQRNESWKRELRSPGSGRATSLLLSAPLLLAGCSHLETMSDCRELSAVINPAFERVEAAYEKGPADAKRWSEIHEQYQKLARDLESLESNDEILEKMRAEFVNLIRRSATLSQAIASALSKDSGHALHSSKAQLRLLAGEEKRLAGRVERLCRPD